MSLLDWLFKGTPDASASSALITSTPAGSQAQQVSPGAGGEVAFSDARAHSGDTSLRFTTPSGVTSLVRLPFASPSMQFAAEVYAWLPAGTTGRVLNVRHASGTAVGVIYGTDSGGRIGLADTANSNNIYSNTGVIQADTLYRFEITGTVGTSPTTGSARVRVFAGNSTTPLATVESTTYNLGTNPVTHMDVGNPAPPGALTVTYVDTVRMNDGTATPIGPRVEAQKLPTPVLTLTATTPTSSPVATDGTATVSWPAVPNAGRYLAESAPGHNATSGFSTIATNVTSPYTFRNLAPGPITLAITALPE